MKRSVLILGRAHCSWSVTKSVIKQKEYNIFSQNFFRQSKTTNILIFHLSKLTLKWLILSGIPYPTYFLLPLFLPSWFIHIIKYLYIVHVQISKRVFKTIFRQEAQ